MSDTKRSDCRVIVDDCEMHCIEFFRNVGNTSINNLLPLCEKRRAGRGVSRPSVDFRSLVEAKPLLVVCVLRH